MRRRRFSLALGVALTIAALLVTAAAAPGATEITGADSVNAMLQGIPQQGIALGRPDAPVTLVEFVEPQCPGCALWAREDLPGVISRYVRPGTVRIEYRGLTFIGSDSDGLLALAQAAGEQNKLWNVVEIEYANQGGEGSGYADRAYLEAIAKAVPGLDVKKAFAAAGSSKVAARIDQAQALSEQYQINETPSFLIGRTGDRKNMTVMANTNGQGLYDSIDNTLAGKPVEARSKGLPAWVIVLFVMAGAAALWGAIGVAVNRRKRPSAPSPAA